MTTDGSKQRRRVLRHYRAEDRERLLREQAASGLSKSAFCKERGINLGTFYGWKLPDPPAQRSPRFAEVELPVASRSTAEVVLPSGVRVRLEHEGDPQGLIALVRGVAGLEGTAPC